MEFRELLNVQSHLEVVSGNFHTNFYTHDALTVHFPNDIYVSVNGFFLMSASESAEKIMAIKFSFCFV